MSLKIQMKNRLDYVVESRDFRIFKIDEQIYEVLWTRVLIRDPGIILEPSELDRNDLFHMESSMSSYV